MARPAILEILPARRGHALGFELRQLPILSAVALTSEFDEPRLVAAYDTLNGYSPGTQPDFYIGLARDLGAATRHSVG